MKELLEQQLVEFSESKVGKVWSEADHVRLIAQLDRVDKLAQDLHDFHARKAEKAVKK